MIASSFDRLEKQISRAVDSLGHLRAEVDRLTRSPQLEQPPSAVAPVPAPPPLPDAAAEALARLTEENKRLRSERALVLGRVRELIRQIDETT